MGCFGARSLFSLCRVSAKTTVWWWPRCGPENVWRNETSSAHATSNWRVCARRCTHLLLTGIHIKYWGSDEVPTGSHGCRLNFLFLKWSVRIPIPHTRHDRKKPHGSSYLGEPCSSSTWSSTCIEYSVANRRLPFWLQKICIFDIAVRTLKIIL